MQYQSSGTTYTIPMPASRGRQPLQQFGLIPTQLTYNSLKGPLKTLFGGIMAANEQVWTPEQK
jgi:hypothetical protein